MADELNIDQEGVDRRILKFVRWCIECFGPKMDLKIRCTLLALMVGWMVGFLTMMGTPVYENEVKSITWRNAIIMLISSFYWLMSLTCSFVVSMAIVVQLQMEFIAVIVMTFALTTGFGFGVFVLFSRGMAYRVHGVSVVVVFSAGIVLFTLLIGFCGWMCRRFGVYGKVKESREQQQFSVLELDGKVVSRGWKSCQLSSCFVVGLWQPLVVLWIGLLKLIGFFIHCMYQSILLLCCPVFQSLRHVLLVLYVLCVLLGAGDLVLFCRITIVVGSS
ncbi:hypothetical protein TSUD_111670 [Trifolium subterraneum]|uniref:Uncharacterized protein n=1 Tax=Trifolium subterraneum TaxID=3900 RepID=A0A2Z6MYX2_TRISU|nr:hypothetical protein TSUD_111670 [Trifolium subterraneum]